VTIVSLVPKILCWTWQLQ